MISGVPPSANEKLNTVTLKSLPAGNKENNVWHKENEYMLPYIHAINRFLQ